MNNNENIKVSLIIPIYNVDKYLSQCVDSVLAQTHYNLEVILVNDGSTDNSHIIAESYKKKDKRITLINKKNEGVSIARNVGIDNATGDYICFVDGDDFVQTDYVQYLLDLAVMNDCNIAISTEMFNTFMGKKLTKDPLDSPMVYPGENAATAILYYHIPIGCYNKIFKRSFLGKTLRFYPKVFVGEGFNFNVNAFQLADKVAIGKRRVYCYRRDNPKSCMTSFNLQKCNMALEAIGIIRKNLLIKSNRMYTACDFALWHTYGDMYNWMVLAKVKKKYSSEYKNYCHIVRSYALRALFSPIKPIEKARALVQLIHPRLYALILELRRYLSSIK